MAHLTKAILSCGEHHSPDGVLKVTPERLQHWADTFKAMQQASLQIPVGVNHSEKYEENIPIFSNSGGGDAALAVGKLTDFQAMEDHAVITLDIGDRQMEAKALDNVVEVSPVIFGSWKDGAGTEWSDCITHVDLVVHPVDHKQGEFKPVENNGMIACSLRMFRPAVVVAYRMSAPIVEKKPATPSRVTKLATEQSTDWENHSADIIDDVVKVHLSLLASPDVALQPLDFDEWNTDAIKLRAINPFKELYTRAVTASKRAIANHYAHIRGRFFPGRSQGPQGTDEERLHYHLRQAKSHGQAADDHWERGSKETNQAEHHKLYKGWVAHREAQRAHLKAARAHLHTLSGSKSLSIKLSATLLNTAKDDFNKVLTFPPLAKEAPTKLALSPDENAATATMHAHRMSSRALDRSKQFGTDHPAMKDLREARDFLNLAMDEGQHAEVSGHHQRAGAAHAELSAHHEEKGEFHPSALHKMAVMAHIRAARLHGQLHTEHQKMSLFVTKVNRIKHFLSSPS